MMINYCQEQPNIESNSKLTKAYAKIKNLIDELNKKTLEQDAANKINAEIDKLNQLEGTDKERAKLINKSYNGLIKSIQKELGLVYVNYYRNLWMSIGMGGFGIPFGAAFFAATQNAAFIGIGIPIGLSIGIAIGMAKDKQAKEENRQLDLKDLY